LLPPQTSRIVSGSMQFTRRNGEVVDLATLDPRGHPHPVDPRQGNRDDSGTDDVPVAVQTSQQIAEAVQLHQGVGTRSDGFATHSWASRSNPSSARRSFRIILGGMRQRAMIAMARRASKLANCRRPTTGVDVTIQAQILELMQAPGGVHMPS